MMTTEQNPLTIQGQSPSIEKLRKLIGKVAPFKTTCLIMGESGSGKELVARAIHQQSPRKAKKFVAINCGAIPENLLESELFGYVKGSFTGAQQDKKGLFEEANQGTLFLDEIGEMTLTLQAKLLRVIQESEIRKVGGVHAIKIDVRLVAATLKNLEHEVEQGRFREDLFYRLNVMPLNVPPLRERKEDIVPLAHYFLEKMNRDSESKVLDAMVLKKLQQHPWPGNVRELENVIERALVVAQGQKRIDVEHLPPQFKQTPQEIQPISPVEMENLSIKKQVKKLEMDLIQQALIETKGNRTHAAKILEISHRSLLYKIKEYELTDIVPKPNQG
jgi:two-component system response regulator AtoC